MRGLRTPEGNKFEAFFKRVQTEAQKQHSVFFLDCGEGNDFATDGIEGEDLRGWLIPNAQADAFEKEWSKGEPDEKWENRIAWAIWKGNPESPDITIEQY